MSHDRSRSHLLIAIAGGAGSGKTTLARRLADDLPVGAPAVLSLDAYYYTDGSHGVYSDPDESGRRFLDLNHPGSMDLDAVLAAMQSRALDQAASPPEPLVIVEGLFALAVPAIRNAAYLRIFVDTPADVRLGRKIARKYEEKGQNPSVTFERYLKNARPRHEEFVEPSRTHAHLVVDGLVAPEAQVLTIQSFLRSRGFVGIAGESE